MSKSIHSLICFTWSGILNRYHNWHKSSLSVSQKSQGTISILHKQCSAHYADKTNVTIWDEENTGLYLLKVSVSEESPVVAGSKSTS